MKLRKGNQADFEWIYQDMLRQFPKEELKDKAWLSDLMGREKYDLWQAEADGSTVAYVLICPHKGYLWLDYIAVFQTYHSKGYGSKILPLLSKAYPDAKGLFLEVEHENKEDPNTARRIRFYRRLGAEMILESYQLPTGEGGFPMGLYFLPFQKEMPQKEEVLDTIRHVFDTVHADIASRTFLLEQIEKDMAKPETAFLKPDEKRL